MTENYWTRRFDRRRVLRTTVLGGAGLAGAALVGCGGDDAEDGPADDADGGTNGTATATVVDSTPIPEGGNAQHGGAVSMHIAAEPPNFDMHANSTYAVNNAISQAFNMLLQFDPAIPSEPPDAVIPDLAESWEVSDDGTQYTFKLVQNARFHNGQDFTSADVQASFDRIMNPPEGVVSPRRGQFGPVESIDAPDDYTVVFRLSRPSSSLIPIIAQGWNVMYSAEDIGNDVDFEQNLNGTGPFRLDEYLRGNRLAYSRNQEYHHDTYPYLDNFTVFIIPDNSTALSSFQSGELLVHRSPTPTDATALQDAMGDTVVIDGPLPAYGFDTINFGQRDPWRDQRVRQAVAMAVNTPDAIAVVEQGVGFLGGYLQPEGFWALPDERLHAVPGYVATDDAILAEARKLLDAAGVANPYQTTMLTRQGASYERLSVFLRDQLGNVGINAELDVQETAAAYDALNTRAFDLAPWSHAYALDDPDAVFAEFYLTDAPRNYSEIGSAEVDDLFAQQSAEMDPEARQELVYQLEEQALALYGKVISSWGAAYEARWPSVMDRTRHYSNYNNSRWERVWLQQ